MATHNATIPILSILLVLMAIQTSGQTIGVCYGMDGNNLPQPNEVIKLYQSNNFRRMRLYAPETRALNALKGSNIELIIDVTNDILQNLASDQAAATGWVQGNVSPYLPGVAFRVIIVGNEVISTNKAQFVLPAMKNIYNALRDAGLQGQIKVSTAIHGPALRDPSFPPSNGAFADEATMGPIVQFLKTTGSPLLANVYPYFSYAGSPSSISIEYALFTSSGVVVTDGSFTYQNLFDAIVDTNIAALEKVGGSTVELIVSETGWPSGGGFAATVSNAMTYNSNLIKHVGQGTPRRPGMLKTYIFAMFNENQKQPQGVENHFGLFNPDKTQVYPIN